MTTAEYWELGSCPNLENRRDNKKFETQELRTIKTFDVIKIVKRVLGILSPNPD